MTITPKTIVLALGVALLAIAVWVNVANTRGPLPPTQPAAETSETSPAPSYETKTSEGGNVTVNITPITLRPGFPASFDVAFETHSVNLDFDVEKIASLITNNQQPTTYKSTWQGSPPGGHHRSGTLIFTPDLAKTDTVTVTLAGIAGVEERTFSWDL